jgi:hypothetical protein
MGHFLTGTITYSKDEIGKKVVSLIFLEMEHILCNRLWSSVCLIKFNLVVCESEIWSPSF